ncbi:putative FAD-binding FR-type domain-containing protein [Seiridium cardinale]
MHSSVVRRETPWLDMPLVLSGNYREYECALEETWQCDYQQGYWRFWYEADHRYALPTVAFFLAVIVAFAFVHVAGNMLPQRLLRTPFLTKMTATFRYLSYRGVKLPLLHRNSAPVGILMLGAVGAIFLFGMTLGPRPYYWPNTDSVDYGSSPPIATRAGWMGLACMPFVFVTAGKTNIITLLTGVSHERLQVFHRWISYVFFILALIHTFPFIVYNFQMDMMTDMWN